MSGAQCLQCVPLPLWQAEQASIGPQHASLIEYAWVRCMPHWAGPPVDACARASIAIGIYCYLLLSMLPPFVHMCSTHDTHDSGNIERCVSLCRGTASVQHEVNGCLVGRVTGCCGAPSAALNQAVHLLTTTHGPHMVCLGWHKSPALQTSVWALSPSVRVSWAVFKVRSSSSIGKNTMRQRPCPACIRTQGCAQ